MSQRHSTIDGTFHITTNAHGKIPWCTWPGIPEILINNLVTTKKLYGVTLSAFCILPDHMHIILWPGEKGLSKFMQSFKSNSSKEITLRIVPQLGRGVPATEKGNIRWQNGFHDERLRNAEQRTNALRYVTLNPVKHGLVESIKDWPWTSLHFEHLLDPSEIWLE